MADRFVKTVTGFNCAGQFACIVQHWRTADATTETPYQLATMLLNALLTPVTGDGYFTRLSHAISDDSYVSSIRVSEAGVGNAPSSIMIFAATDFPGDFGSTLDAAQVAGVMVCVTAGSGTPNGRNFIPGVAEGAYENGLPAVAYRNALDDVANFLLNPVNASGVEFHFALKHGDPPSFTDVAHLYLSSTAGTIRKRLVPF